MPKQVEVKVKDISLDDQGHKTELYGTVRIITYTAFKYLNSNPDNPRYELLGEVDGKGELVPGNPNLNSQHQLQATAKNAKPVAEAGIKQEPTVTQQFAQINEDVKPEDKQEPEKAKRGRPKQTVTEVSV